MYFCWHATRHMARQYFRVFLCDLELEDDEREKAQDTD